MRAVDREELWLKSMQNAGEFLESIGPTQMRGVPEGTRWKGFNVRLPSEDRPECLIVLKASGKGGDFVAFVGALSLLQAVLAWRARYLKGSIKWRVDVPYGER